MTDDKTHGDGLEAYFSAARDSSPAPSTSLLARIAQDALAAQAPVLDRQQPQSGWLIQLWKGLGGWPAIGGLVTATVAGVWIGVNPPGEMASMAESYLGTESTGYIVDLRLDGAFDLVEEAL